MERRIPELTESFVTIVDPHTDCAQNVTTPSLPITLGSYRIVRSLGVGGSGFVYEARRSNETRVALKVLRAEHLSSERELDRFRDEAEHLARLAHPAIVGLEEAGVLPDGRPFLAMTYLEGETLAARIEHSGALPIDEAVSHFMILADALAACHGAGLVHRDLKPENVFFEATNEGVRPVLLDLGIAQPLATTTTTTVGRIRGTPVYMAPERLLGTKADVASDIYELAVVFAIMLSGRFPWRSTSNLFARLSPLPNEIAKALPPTLVEVIRRALSASPDDRPSSARAFADEVAFGMLLDSARGREEDSEAAHPPSATGTKRGHGRSDPRRGRSLGRRARDGSGHGEGHRTTGGRESGLALSVLPGPRGDRRGVGSEGARASAVDPRGRRCTRAR